MLTHSQNSLTADGPDLDVSLLAVFSLLLLLSLPLPLLVFIFVLLLLAAGGLALLAVVVFLGFAIALLLLVLLLLLLVSAEEKRKRGEAGGSGTLLLSFCARWWFGSNQTLFGANGGQICNRRGNAQSRTSEGKETWSVSSWGIC